MRDAREDTAVYLPSPICLRSSVDRARVFGTWCREFKSLRGLWELQETIAKAWFHQVLAHTGVMPG